MRPHLDYAVAACYPHNKRLDVLEIAFLFNFQRSNISEIDAEPYSDNGLNNDAIVIEDIFETDKLISICFLKLEVY